ncbi:transporter substrate-binding domain-containing protein [Pseudodesulfovibrio sp.]|nr:transporter substrate-binding domain-containing protein [Pseudodesulfovibrio sp.]
MKIYGRLFPGIVMLAFTLISSPCLAEESIDPATQLTYLTEDFKPYNYLEYGLAKGLGVDLLRLTWQQMDVPAQRLEFMPWPRAYSMVQSQPNTVLFSMVKTPEREPLFKWVGPIALSRTLLIAKGNSPLTMNDLEDAKGLTIGVVRDYMSAQILERHKNLFTIDTLSSVDLCIKKLLSGRIHLISIEERTFTRAIQKKHLPPESFKTAWVLNETLSYYAFHKDTDDALIARFQEAFDAVRTTPEFDELTTTYLK